MNIDHVILLAIGMTIVLGCWCKLLVLMSMNHIHLGFRIYGVYRLSNMDMDVLLEVSHFKVMDWKPCMNSSAFLTFRVCPDDDCKVKLETQRTTADQTVGSTLTVNLQQAFTPSSYCFPLLRSHTSLFLFPSVHLSSALPVFPPSTCFPRLHLHYSIKVKELFTYNLR